MPALQIRDLSQRTYDDLKLRAELEHRSMAQQATVAIEEHLRMLPSRDERGDRRGMESETREERAARHKAILERISQMPKVQIPDDFPSIVEIIHEGREERDHGCFGL